jgi:hypothetical protein
MIMNILKVSLFLSLTILLSPLIIYMLVSSRKAH